MSRYNYLKIDFYGQFNDDTLHKLTYPETYNPMDTSSLLWLNPITDPRAIRSLFPMAKYGYKIHRDANGTYYSLLTRYERDTRQGYVAITVMIGAQYESVINGKAIFNLLNLLKTNVLDTNDITSMAVEQCLASCQMPTLDVDQPVVTPMQNPSQQAFRVYGSNEELYDIFQFPEQSQLDQYGEVFLINKFWCNNEVPGVERLTSPIVKTYNATPPASDTDDRTSQTTPNITHNTPMAAVTKWLIPILSFLLGAAIASVVTFIVMRDKGGTETSEQNPATVVTDSVTTANKNASTNLDEISNEQSNENNKTVKGQPYFSGER